MIVVTHVCLADKPTTGNEKNKIPLLIMSHTLENIFLTEEQSVP